VKFYIQFGSQETREYCIRKGYLEIFASTGPVGMCDCSLAVDLHQRRPGVTTRPEQVVISAQNRNSPAAAGRDRCTWPVL